MSKVSDGRAQQAGFRNTTGTISEPARRPTDPQGARHGHLLALGREDENLFPPLRGENGARRFFSDRGIKWWRSSTSGDSKEHEGPTRNLASSQIACVNFLMPLAAHPAALAALLRALDHDVASVEQLSYVPRGLSRRVTTPVEFEWIGLQAPLEGKPYTRGANVTSADALVVGTTTAGRRRAYLFEWKYVEEYGDEYLGGGEKGATRKSRYEERYAASPLFDHSVPMDELLYDPFYQIMRLGLLADQMIREQEFGVSEARVAVVCPQENVQYRTRITSRRLHERFRGTVTVEDAASQIWQDRSTFRMATPAGLAAAIRGECGSGPLREWIGYMTERYGWS